MCLVAHFTLFPVKWNCDRMISGRSLLARWILSVSDLQPAFGVNILNVNGDMMVV